MAYQSQSRSTLPSLAATRQRASSATQSRVMGGSMAHSSTMASTVRAVPQHQAMTTKGFERRMDARRIEQDRTDDLKRHHVAQQRHIANTKSDDRSHTARPLPPLVVFFLVFGFVSGVRFD